MDTMIRTLLLFALLLACVPAVAGAQGAGQMCPDARTQLEMNRCASDELARADSALNHRYQHLIRGLQPERVEPLRVAQRAWIRFRDAECAFRAARYAGGSLQPFVRATCLAGLTRERTEHFGEMLAGETLGAVVPEPGAADHGR